MTINSFLLLNHYFPFFCSLYFCLISCKVPKLVLCSTSRLFICHHTWSYWTSQPQFNYERVTICQVILWCWTPSLAQVGHSHLCSLPRKLYWNLVKAELGYQQIVSRPPSTPWRHLLLGFKSDLTYHTESVQWVRWGIKGENLMIVLFSCLTMSPPLVYRSTIYCSFMNSRFCWVLFMLFLSHLDRFCATISLWVEDFLSMTDNQESDFSQIFRVTPHQ